jgi:hypothetical protein
VPDVRYRDALGGSHPEPTGDGFVEYDGYGDVAGTLRISGTTYERPGSDARITLLGVVHVGDEGYYGEVQEVLDAADVVLFELIKPADFEMDVAPTGGTYGPLAETIGLVEQMATIDYRRDHFRWLDMDAETFMGRIVEIFSESAGRIREILRERGIEIAANRPAHGVLAEGFARAPEAVRRALAATLFELPIRVEAEPDGVEDPTVALLELFLLPMRAEKTYYEIFQSRKAFEDKYQHNLAIGLGESGNAATMAGLDAGPGQDPLVEVLLEAVASFMNLILVERNQVVLDGIASLLERGEISGDVVVFYGAAHNQGLAAGLVEMGFERVGEPSWFEAISITR